MTYKIALFGLLLAGLPIQGAAADESGRIIGVYGGTGNAVREKSLALGANHLYPAITWSADNSYMAGICKQAHEQGALVLPSLAMGYDRDHELVRAHPEYYEKWQDGRDVNESWAQQLSWAHPEVRDFKVRTVVRNVQRWEVDGVALDYTRMFTTRSGYCDAMVNPFKEKTGRDPFAIDRNDEQWVRFRAEFVTQFVRELRAALPADKQIWACVNPDPDECLRNAMQDWRTWMDEKLIDGVVSMSYTRDTNELMANLLIANAVTRGKVPHVPMLAVTENFMTGPALLRHGGMNCLASGAAGVGFYHGAEVARLSLWPVVEEIVARTRAGDVDAPAVNYVQNSGFERGFENWATGDGEGLAAEPNQVTMTFPGRRAMRQVINKGLLPDHHAARVRVGYRAVDLSGDANAVVTLSVWDRRGKEKLLRAAMDLQADTAEALLAIGPTQEVRRIVLSIEVEASSGTMAVDSVALHLVKEKAGVTAETRSTDSRGKHTPSGVNLARGQIVECSSYWEQNFAADNAVDGDVTTDDHGIGAEWHSARPAVNQSLTVLLPRRQIVSRLRLLNSSTQTAYRTREFRVEVSLDGERYREVASGVMPDDCTTWVEVDFQPTLVRFLRFVGVNGYNRDYSVGLLELEAYR